MDEMVSNRLDEAEEVAASQYQDEIDRLAEENQTMAEELVNNGIRPIVKEPGFKLPEVQLKTLVQRVHNGSMNHSEVADKILLDWLADGYEVWQWSTHINSKDEITRVVTLRRDIPTPDPSPLRKEGKEEPEALDGETAPHPPAPSPTRGEGEKTPPLTPPHGDGEGNKTDEGATVGPEVGKVVEEGEETVIEFPPSVPIPATPESEIPDEPQPAARRSRYGKAGDNLPLYGYIYNKLAALQSDRQATAEDIRVRVGVELATLEDIMQAKPGTYSFEEQKVICDRVVLQRRWPQMNVRVNDHQELEMDYEWLQQPDSGHDRPANGGFFAAGHEKGRNGKVDDR